MGSGVCGHTELLFTHSGGFDGKLALPVHQAVLDDGEEARVCVRSTDTHDGGAQIHVLKHGLLQTQRASQFNEIRVKCSDSMVK